MIRLRRLPKAIYLTACVALIAAAGGYLARNHWFSRRAGETDASSGPPAANATDRPTGQVLLSDQGIANLGLKAKPVHPQTYWKTIQVPGMVVDRPGQTDRCVVAPATGVITHVNRAPGDIVNPGEILFTIRLLSESLHQTQSELFKAAEGIKLARARQERLRGAGEAIPGVRLIEVDNQITLLQASVRTCGQELASRGLTPAQLDEVMEGKFVTEINIAVPNHPAASAPRTVDPLPPANHPVPPRDAIFVLQEFTGELGQQIQAGQTLCLLANPRLLAIEGRAFRDETPLLERSVKEGWPVEVDFQEDSAAGWPPSRKRLFIRQLANIIDPVNRTFAFYISLENEARTVDHNGQTRMLWRFRPGQKARILVKVEKLDNVFVLPADAVARDGAEAFVFTQNVNTFERKSVRVVTQDRRHAVIANDGSLLPGTYVVQNVAAQLDRMAKSQSSVVPKGYHVHPDGSLHKNEDEVK